MSRENVPKMSSVCVAILINTSLAIGHRIGAVTAVTYCFTQLIIRVGFMDQLLFLSLCQQCQSRCCSATMCYSIICCGITAHCKTTSPLLYYFSSKTVEQCEIGRWEIWYNCTGLLPCVLYWVGCLFTFCVSSCVVVDWLDFKPVQVYDVFYFMTVEKCWL